ncbi:hypothetical protein RB195_017579 [Necator americanus]|uniref:RFX1-4/6/8-like BCD domain-containing protein n=1 Tax=Necator americanus TaxID=51031 RepID=A0ABR1C5V8_NECAM
MRKLLGGENAMEPEDILLDDEHIQRPVPKESMSGKPSQPYSSPKGLPTVAAALYESVSSPMQPQVAIVVPLAATKERIHKTWVNALSVLRRTTLSTLPQAQIRLHVLLMFPSTILSYNAIVGMPYPHLCSEPTELLESSAYAAPAPHYVTEFGMEYPLSSHINNNTEVNKEGREMNSRLSCQRQAEREEIFGTGRGVFLWDRLLGDDGRLANGAMRVSKAISLLFFNILFGMRDINSASAPRMIYLAHDSVLCGDSYCTYSGQIAPNTTTYVYTDNNQYNNYYQYSGNLHSPSQSYMIHGHGSQSPVSVEDDNSTGLGAATRASPATIQWLLDNYETADGTSLPRCALYDHYKNALKRPNTAMSMQSSRPASSSPAPRQSPNAPPPSAANGHSRNEVSDTDRLSLGNGEVPFIQTPQTDGLIEALPKLGLELSHVVLFVNAYNHNCSEVLYCVKQLQFEQIEEYWTTFWQPEDDLEDEDKALGQARLSQQQLFSLCTLPQIQHWVVSLDLAFYQTLVDVLVPDVLMSSMSPFLTQSCRNFAKNVEHYLKKAMQGAPEIMQKKKIQAVKYMAQGLRRYTSLNHLAQAARAVLQKPDQVTAMYNDYIRVDMQQVQEQAGWVSGCDSLMVHHIHNAFKDNLQKMAPMEEWAEWLESIVDQILAKYHDKPVQVISEVGKQFLLNWSCYTSMLIRDLTLRSAGSFGSFHLIRLLTDEYMVYLVESRIAKAANRAMITVISQPTDYPLFDDALPPLPQMSLSQQYIIHSRPSEHMYDQKFSLHRSVERTQVPSMGSEMLEIGNKSMLI